MGLIELTLALVATTQDSKGPRGGLIEWTKDYDAGSRESRLTGMPAMLYFTADW